MTCRLVCAYADMHTGNVHLAEPPITYLQEADGEMSPLDLFNKSVVSFSSQRGHYCSCFVAAIENSLHEKRQRGNKQNKTNKKQQQQQSHVKG